MKNNQYIGSLLLTVISLVLIAIGIKNYHPSVEEVEVVKGQVWIYESEDPFNPLTDESEVLEVRGEYVKYRNMETGAVHSSSIFMFKTCARLKAPSKAPAVIEIPGARTQWLRTPRSIGPDVLITGGD